MKGVEDIFVGQRSIHRIQKLTVIIWGSDTDDGIRRIAADQRNDLVRIGADIFPGCSAVGSLQISYMIFGQSPYFAEIVSKKAMASV